MSPEPRTESAWRRLPTEFAIDEVGLYLNHAAIAPWPRGTMRAVTEFARENLARGPAQYALWIAREAELRRDLAALCGARSQDDIALMKNTTECISAVAWGLDWRDGDNLVLPVGEFPSNRLPWLAQRSRGVEVREVDIRGADDAESALLEAVDGRTRLLSVSAVQWSDGFRLDLARLGAVCHERGVLFFVDAIQQLGALPVDVEACHIDFLAADAHKWLLGPEGIAVFYSREPARLRLELLQQGWHMFDDPWNFERDDWIPTRRAQRFEAGSPNTLGQVALHASVRLLLELGMESVGERVLANTGFLLQELPRLPGLELVTRSEPARRSGIVTFRTSRLGATGLKQALSQRGVACAIRDGGIRLSPHCYQDQQALAGAVRILEELLG